MTFTLDMAHKGHNLARSEGAWGREVAPGPGVSCGYRGNGDESARLGVKPLNFRGENTDAPLDDVVVLGERYPQALVTVTPRLGHAGKEMMA